LCAPGRFCFIINKTGSPDIGLNLCLHSVHG
jgi:hypothetical protein